MKTMRVILASICLAGMQGRCEEDQSLPLISSLSVGAGITRHNHISIARLGVRRDSQYTFFENPSGWLSLYYEGSVGYWDKGDDHIVCGALSPVFVYYFGAPDWIVQPYIEAGIGFSAISEKRIDTRNLSTVFQFEDRIGVGLRTADFDISIRYMHYSNASISQPNDGIDILIATIGYRF
jgi:lipid A 3-O-deacylase